MKYYGVERSTDHLAHYGVKGMRWGVRKAIATGNQRSLDRHYRKAAKKLAKLQKIGNNPYKYAAKSAAYGVAAAGTGTIAIGGTGLAAKGIRYGVAGVRKLKQAAGIKRGEGVLNKVGGLSGKLENWGNRESKLSVNRPVINDVGEVVGSKNVVNKNVSNNTLFRIGAAAATAGLAAKSAQNAYRAAKSEQYREKATRWKDEMDSNFVGTRWEGHYEKFPRQRKRRR